MYPDLSYIIEDSVGIKLAFLSTIKTFGFLLSLAFTLTFSTFYYAVKKREKIVTFKKDAPLYLSFYDLLEVVLVTIFSSFIGGYLFSYIETKTFESLSFNYLGGLSGGLIASFCYCYKYRIDLIGLLDCISYPLLWGYSVGRLGCHLSGDGDWGINNLNPKPYYWIFPDWTWAYSYPHNILNLGIPIKGCLGSYCNQLEFEVFPTSFYESVISMLGGTFIFFIKGYLWDKKGMLFCLYLLFIGIERFLIEFIRINPKYGYLYNLSQAQIISILIVCISLFFIAKLMKQDKK